MAPQHAKLLEMDISSSHHWHHSCGTYDLRCSTGDGLKLKRLVASLRSLLQPRTQSQRSNLVIWISIQPRVSAGVYTVGYVPGAWCAKRCVTPRARHATSKRLGTRYQVNHRIYVTWSITHFTQDGCRVSISRNYIKIKNKHRRNLDSLSYLLLFMFPSIVVWIGSSEILKWKMQLTTN